MKPKYLSVWFVVLLGVGLCLWAFLFEPRQLELRTIHLYSEKFSSDFAGLRILQMSDLHLPSMSAGLRKKVQLAAAKEAPDLIVITGDLFSDGDVFESDRRLQLSAELNMISAFLADLHAPMGIRLVRGNHDFGDDKEVSNVFVETMRRSGYHMLTNQKETLTRGAETLYLFGLDYSLSGENPAAFFRVQEKDHNRYLQSNSSETNSYSHFFPEADSGRWANYTLSARLRLSDSRNAGIGVTFYSQFHQGLDRFYRLRWSPEQAQFFLSPHGTQVEGITSVKYAMPDDVWTLVKVRIGTQAEKTVIFAKVWSEGDPEPDGWSIQAFDDSPLRLQGGTVGMWSVGKGAHQMDEVCVVRSEGDTLLYEDWQGIRPRRKHVQWIDFKYNGPALTLLCRNVPDSCYRILLNHTPDVVAEAQENHIDLQVSGHTHGGQIRLPLLGAPLVHTSLGRRYVQGLFSFGATTLYVNRGLGTIVIPARFLCPPELTLFVLEKPDRNADRRIDSGE